MIADSATHHAYVMERFRFDLGTQKKLVDFKKGKDAVAFLECELKHSAQSISHQR